jgi:uncharacterized protein
MDLPKTTPVITRRSFLKRAGLATLGLLALPPGGLAYARYAEPQWLDVERITLRLARWPKSLQGLRIVQFSDVHFGFHFGLTELAQLVERINRLDPDVICFTGDFVDYGIDQDGPEASRLLQQLRAKLGVYAVLGNHDYYGGMESDVAKMLQDGGVRLLRNEAVQVKHGEAAFWIAGIEDQWEGKPDLPSTASRIQPDDFVLLLSHCPDFADMAAAYPVDLQLSGHSHGGQVRLPFYGHIVTPSYSKKYVKGHYTLAGGKLQLYVNRGIGVSVYPIRFWCRPELTVFTMEPA